MKIFRSSETQMKTRLNSEKERRMKAKRKEAHTHIDSKSKHATNQRLVSMPIISLPIEKILEKKCPNGLNLSY